MDNETKQAAPWPLDALEGARMILGVFQTIYHPGHVVVSAKGMSGMSFDVILDDAEQIVKAALSRSRENCKAGPMGAFFEQQTAPQKCPECGRHHTFPSLFNRNTGLCEVFTPKKDPKP